jgi:hypothetical protein
MGLLKPEYPTAMILAWMAASVASVAVVINEESQVWGVARGGESSVGSGKRRRVRCGEWQEVESQAWGVARDGGVRCVLTVSCRHKTLVKVSSSTVRIIAPGGQDNGSLYRGCVVSVWCMVYSVQ